MMLMAQATALIETFKYDPKIRQVIGEVWMLFLQRFGFTGLLHDALDRICKGKAKLQSNGRFSRKAKRVAKAQAAKLEVERASQAEDNKLSQRLQEEDSIADDDDDDDDRADASQGSEGDGGKKKKKKKTTTTKTASLNSKNGEMLAHLKVAEREVASILKERKDLFGDKNYRNKYYEPLWYVSRPEGPSLEVTLGICYCALVYIRAPVMPGDLVNWVVDGRLPYLAPWDNKELPQSDRKEVYRMFKGDMRMPVPVRISGMPLMLSQRTGVGFPPVNVRGLGLRLLHEFGLPSEPLIDPLMNIFARSGVSAALPKMQSKRPPEAGVLASLVVLVKMIYKLDADKHDVLLPPYVPECATALPTARDLVAYWEGMVRRCVRPPVTLTQLDELANSAEVKADSSAEGNSTRPLYSYLRYCAQKIFVNADGDSDAMSQRLARLGRIALDDPAPFAPGVPRPPTSSHSVVENTEYSLCTSVGVPKDSTIAYPQRLLVELCSHYLFLSPFQVYHLVRKVETVVFKPAPTTPGTQAPRSSLYPRLPRRASIFESRTLVAPLTDTHSPMLFPFAEEIARSSQAAVDHDEVEQVLSDDDDNNGTGEAKAYVDDGADYFAF